MKSFFKRDSSLRAAKEDGGKGWNNKKSGAVFHAEYHTTGKAKILDKITKKPRFAGAFAFGLGSMPQNNEGK